MGKFSELDIQKNQSGAFNDDMDIPAFSEADEDVVPFGAVGNSDAVAAKEAAPAGGCPPAVPNKDKGSDVLPSTNVGNTAAGVTGSTEDDAKRKEHEAAEKKRKAEWEARQQKKKAAEQEQIARLESMSDDEVMIASTKRVNDDTEKLTRRNMKDCVSEYIQTKCLDDPAFARKTMYPRKSMVHCFQYINRKAWDYIQDELKANGITPGPGRQMYGSDIPNDLCYQWAVDYFNDPDAKEDQEEDEKFVPKPYYGKSAASKKAVKKETKKPGAPKPQPKKAADTGQISLGGFSMPEGKAG